MNSVRQAITAIHSLETNEELNQVIEAVKLKRQYLAGVPVGGTLLEKVVIRQGDCSMTFEGGHTHLILEDDTVVYEYKAMEKV